MKTNKCRKNRKKYNKKKNKLFKIKKILCLNNKK